MVTAWVTWITSPTAALGMHLFLAGALFVTTGIRHLARTGSRRPFLVAVFVALLPVAIPALGGLSPVLFTFYGAAFHVRAEEMDVAAAWQFAASVYVVAIMGRVRVRKYCEVEDREVTNAEIGKGYQLTKEQVIPISDEELREIPLPTAKAIEIEAFVPLESIDPIRIGEGYYLQPSGQVAAKPYRLLVQALGVHRRSPSPSTPGPGGIGWASCA